MMTTNISTITLLTSKTDPRVILPGVTVPYYRCSVYLSGPMTLLNQKSRAALLSYAWMMSMMEKELVARDCIVYNPYSSVLHPGNFDPDMHLHWIRQGEHKLKSAMRDVEDGYADRAVWLGGPGWRQSDGSTQEQGFARENGVELIGFKRKFLTKELVWSNFAFYGVK